MEAVKELANLTSDTGRRMELLNSPSPGNACLSRQAASMVLETREPWLGRPELPGLWDGETDPKYLECEKHEFLATPNTGANELFSELAARELLSIKPGHFGAIYADPPWRFTNRTGKMAPEHKRLR